MTSTGSTFLARQIFSARARDGLDVSLILQSSKMARLANCDLPDVGKLRPDLAGNPHS